MTKLIPLDAAIGAIEKWWNNPQSTAQSPMTLLRAIPTIDPAAIREAALKEAADRARKIVECCQSCASVEAAILALIGEKK